MTLTKRDLVVRISEETGLIQTQVFDVVQKTLDYIAEALSKGDKVELRNFGVFEVKLRKARKARNPRTGDKVDVPPKNVVTFKPGKEMEERVRRLNETMNKTKEETKAGSVSTGNGANEHAEMAGAKVGRGRKAP